MAISREQFIKNQEEACKNVPGGMFMPRDGRCWACKRDIIDKLIEKGNDGKEWVTGCPLCNRSYCD